MLHTRRRVMTRARRRHSCPPAPFHDLCCRRDHPSIGLRQSEPEEARTNGRARTGSASRSPAPLEIDRLDDGRGARRHDLVAAMAIRTNRSCSVRLASNVVGPRCRIADTDHERPHGRWLCRSTAGAPRYTGIPGSRRGRDVGISGRGEFAACAQRGLQSTRTGERRGQRRDARKLCPADWCTWCNPRAV